MRSTFIAVWLAGMISLLVGPLAYAARLVLVAGGGDGADGVPATQAKLVSPFGVDFDKDGNTYLVELEGQRVLQIDGKGVFRVLAGVLGEKGHQGDGGPAANARFNGMHSLAVAKDGTLYLADTWNNRVRKLDPSTKIISAFAGTGEKGDDADSPHADIVRFGGIYCVAFDPQGENLYLVDLDNRRVRRVHLASRTVTTVAGNGKKGVPADGAEARQAPLVDPRAVAVDRKGNIYILERGGHALRVVDSNGKIRTVVGTGKAGATGDDGPARLATLRGPKHLCIDHDDNVIIADTDNHAIRKYLPREGKIVRVAGSGKQGKAGLGGPPEKAELFHPHGVTVHASGVLYIVDSGNHQVLRIEEP